MTQCKNILVVGNGFDLALKLPTSYQHFMKSFLRYIAEQCNLPICTIKEKVLSDFNELFTGNMHNLKASWDETKDGVFDDVMLKNVFIIIMIFKYNPSELARSFIVPGSENSSNGTTMYPCFEENHDLSEPYYKDNDIANNSFNWFNVEEILAQISNSNEFSNIATTIKKCAKYCHVLPRLYGNMETFAINKENQKPEHYSELIKGLKLFKKSLAAYLFTVEQYYDDKFSENFYKKKFTSRK